MFDILPIVIQSDRKKRNVEKEIHVYESENNHHAIFKRSIKADNTETNDLIDYMIVDGIIFRFLI